jgi:cytochrome b561
MLKSSPDRYGAVAISIHWLSAILIFVLLGSGFLADAATDPATKSVFLRLHLPAGLAVLLLTLVRIAWWRFDQKPSGLGGSPAWQAWLARSVHLAFYILILVMVASGVGMMILSGAAPVVFGEPGTLPDFQEFAPRAPHGLGALLLAVLLALHVGAALYHHFALRDGVLRRIWFGRSAL